MVKFKIVDEIEDVMQAILDGVAWIHDIVGDTTSVGTLMSKVGDVMRDKKQFKLYEILGFATVLFELLAVGEDGDKIVPVLGVYFKLLENFVEFAHERSKLEKKAPTPVK